jgi:PhnB protein
MVKIIPYLLVSNGKEAIALYQTIFDAKLLNHQPFSVEIVKSMDLPQNMDYDNSTMHATIEIGGSIIYIADNNQQTQDYGHVEITLELDDKEQIKAFYNRSLEHQCKVKLELKQFPWSWYARIEDPFGVVWQLNFLGRTPN